MAQTLGASGRCAPAWPKDALRIGFGVIWLIDAVLKWLPGFRASYMSTIMGEAGGQPGWLQPWFDFWIRVQHPQAMFFAWMVAVIETLIAVALITGFARKLTYCAAIVFSLLIWSTAEGFGGPYQAGSTDIGAAIIYALVFAGLFLSSAGLYYGLDRQLTPKLGKLGVLASGWFQTRAETEHTASTGLASLS